GYPVRVLPPRPFQCQNVFPDYLSVFYCRRSPVLPDGAPSIAEAFFIRIPVLRNDSRNSVRVSHRQTEAYRRAVIEYIECKAVDFERRRERLDRLGQSIERVRIFSFGRNFGKSETGEVRRDHPVAIGEAWNEFAKHER